jgi:hypothetical protein
VHWTQVGKQRGETALDGARGYLGHICAHAFGLSQYPTALAEPCPARGAADVEAENR